MLTMVAITVATMADITIPGIGVRGATMTLGIGALPDGQSVGTGAGARRSHSAGAGVGPTMVGASPGAVIITTTSVGVAVVGPTVAVTTHHAARTMQVAPMQAVSATTPAA
jgi:hypothetical protein